MRTKSGNGHNVDLDQFMDDLKVVVKDGQELLRAGVSTARTQALAGARTTDKAHPSGNAGRYRIRRWRRPSHRHSELRRFRRQQPRRRRRLSAAHQWLTRPAFPPGFGVRLSSAALWSARASMTACLTLGSAFVPAELGTFSDSNFEPVSIFFLRHSNFLSPPHLLSSAHG